MHRDRGRNGAATDIIDGVDLYPVVFPNYYRHSIFSHSGSPTPVYVIAVRAGDFDDGATAAEVPNFLEPANGEPSFVDTSDSELEAPILGAS